MSSDKKAAGGGIAQTGSETQEMKKGGKLKRKSGGKIPGVSPKARLDKSARGGSPKNPMSGANAPNLGYAKPNLSIDQGGKGKEKHT